MSDGESRPTSWMAYSIPLTEELKLEQAIREVSGHPDMDKVRALCASLMRSNYHQQQLLANAVGRIGELELVLFLGAHAEPSEVSAFLSMAREVCEDLGIG
jgi:hypothetical protein